MCCKAYWVFPLVITDQMALKKKAKEGKNQNVQKGCYVEIVRLSYFFCAKGVDRAKLTVCDCGLLQFRSDMQNGSFFN